MQQEHKINSFLEKSDFFIKAKGRKGIDWYKSLHQVKLICIAAYIAAMAISQRAGGEGENWSDGERDHYWFN